MNRHFSILVPFNLIIESGVEVDLDNLQFCFHLSAWGKSLCNISVKMETDFPFFIEARSLPIPFTECNIFSVAGHHFLDSRKNCDENIEKLKVKGAPTSVCQPFGPALLGPS